MNLGKFTDYMKKKQKKKIGNSEKIRKFEKVSKKSFMANIVAIIQTIYV